MNYNLYSQDDAPIVFQPYVDSSYLVSSAGGSLAVSTEQGQTLGSVDYEGVFTPTQDSVNLTFAGGSSSQSFQTGLFIILSNITTIA